MQIPDSLVLIGTCTDERHSLGYDEIRTLDGIPIPPSPSDIVPVNVQFTISIRMDSFQYQRYNEFRKARDFTIPVRVELRNRREPEE